MLKDYKATILIYVIVLVSLLLMLGVVVINNYSILLNNASYIYIEDLLEKNIITRAKTSSDYTVFFNSNGDGFRDIISCPDSIYMSGSVAGTISSSIYNDSAMFFCSGSFNSQNLSIYFNPTYTGFSGATFGSQTIALSGIIDMYGLFSASSTYISFSGTSYQKSDFIDDNFNSDNYSWYNTGTSIYPLGFQDDDDNARINITGNSYSGEISLAFWDNKKIENYISANLYNTGSLRVQLGDVNQGYLHFILDKDIDIKVVEFDKSLYDSTNQISIKSVNTGTILAGSGYLQKDYNSLGDPSPSNGLKFNFQAKDYAIFFTNRGEDFLSYNIKGIDNFGNSIYLNPINDYDVQIIKVLGYDILINQEGTYIGKLMEIIKKK